MNLCQPRLQTVLPLQLFSMRQKEKQTGKKLQHAPVYILTLLVTDLVVKWELVLALHQHDWISCIKTKQIGP